MGRNSYLGGSTVIGPGSSWFSKPKKKVVKKKPRTEEERRRIFALKEARYQAEAAERRKKEVMVGLRQRRKAAEKKRLSETECRRISVLEEAARRAKAAKMQEHEEMLRLQREAKAAKKQKSAENLRLQQKRKAAERTARKLLHDARSEAARLSKQSRIEKELTAAPVASETQGQSVLNPRQKGRRPPRSNPVVVIMKGGRIVRSGVKQ